MNVHQSPQIAARVGQLIKLALSATQPGEALGALAAVRRVLAASDLDLHAVEIGLQAPQPAIQPDDWRSRAWFCHHRIRQLDGRDAAFIVTIVKYRGDISPKQEKWLNDLYEKLRGDR